MAKRDEQLEERAASVVAENLRLRRQIRELELEVERVGPATAWRRDLWLRAYMEAMAYSGTTSRKAAAFADEALARADERFR